jgi:hypothetical protein
MSAADFKLQLNAGWKVKKRKMFKVWSQIANDALTGIVMKAPVDTGRFRSNIILSIDIPDITTLPKTTIKGAGQVISDGQSKIKSQPGITSQQNQGTDGQIFPIYIQNNLPYAMRLENGWSKQAPAGMIAITLNELQHKYDGMII